jgi:hypothetical protein
VKRALSSGAGSGRDDRKAHKKRDLKKIPFFVPFMFSDGESNLADAKGGRPSTFVGYAVRVLHQIACTLRQELFHVLFAFAVRLGINNVAVLIHEIQDITLHKNPPFVMSIEWMICCFEFKTYWKIMKALNIYKKIFFFVFALHRKRDSQSQKAIKEYSLSNKKSRLFC